MVWVMVQWCVSHVNMLGLCCWPVVGSDGGWVVAGKSKTSVL